MAMPSRSFEIPQGLAVLPDGSWQVGGQKVVHSKTLRYLKSHLAFEAQGAFVEDGTQRMEVVVDGPAFEAVSLVIDAARGTARVVLDDGSEEPVQEDSIGMDPRSGRFQCTVRGGRALALLSRGAHQTLLANVRQDADAFYLQAGARRFGVRA